MARIRNIKPDFWTDEKLVELDAVDRLLFIGIWNFADDEGYMPYSPKRIKMQVFPGDSLDISRGLQNLISARVLTLYDSDNGQVLKVTNWTKHQKVSNPTKSKYSDMDLQEVGPKPRKHADSYHQNTEDYQSSTEDSRELNTEGEREWEGERVVKRTPSPATPSKHFDQFWEWYPRKVGKDAARKAFDKATRRTPVQNIVDGLERYRLDPNLPSKEFIPHPATWLNEGRWDDEPLPERSNGKPTTNDRVNQGLALVQQFSTDQYEIEARHGS